MKLSVKKRIQLVMTVIVAVNLVAGVVSWDLYAAASQSAARARAAADRARLASAASASVTEFMAASTDLALGVSRSTTSPERSRLYGTLIGTEPNVNRAVERVAAATDGDSGEAAVRTWQSLRVAVYAWINTEAQNGGADLRITRNPNGSFRDSVRTNLSLPADLAALPTAALRQAVRDRAERYKYSTLGDIVKTAEADSAAAATSEARARLKAQQGTVALVALSALVAILLGGWLYRSISRPLSAAKHYADRVAGGEYDAVLAKHSADEIGVLTHAVENMKNNLVHEMNVMREMAGAVMFTAEGVKEAASNAGTLVERPDHDATQVKAGLADVTAQVDILQELSRQMLGM